jgi:hypothetical protein
MTMMRWFGCAIVLAAALAVVAAGQAPAPRLIAHYPLDRDLTDATGHHAPLQTKSAPLQPGKGLFCNGRYSLGDPDGCDARTPPLDDLDPSALTISAQFFVAHEQPFLNPVFVAGNRWRWLSYELLEDRRIRLSYNGGQHVECNLTYQYRVWHEATITVDGKTVTLYLDGKAGCRVDAALRIEQDKVLLLTNFGSGATFHGALRDLRIYNGVVVPSRQTPTPDDVPDPTPLNLAPVDRFLMTCPTREQLAAVDADLKLSFDTDPTKGQPLACTAAGGSRDLSPMKKRVYNTLLLMQQLRFDQPLPWTTAPLYRWFVGAVKGIRFRADIEHSSCCTSPGTLNMAATHMVIRYTDRWVEPETHGGLSGFLLVLVHEARHADGAIHTCGTRDKTVEELGAWGAQYYLARWLTEHTDQTFFSAGSLRYNDTLVKEANTIRKNEFCGA